MPLDPGPEFMRRLAAAAAAQTLPRFRRKSNVATKLADSFDPVTEADREAELAIRSIIRAEFPKHGILGEEFGSEQPDNSHVWVIDPIDGTRAFISGLPLWGTLVGLIVEGRAVSGMMSQPFTGEFYYANSSGAFYEGPGGESRLRVSTVTSLADATLCTTSPYLFATRKRGLYEKVEEAVRLPRYGTDCYAYAMLAAGHVDLVVESALQPYDIVALIPIIEKAGGVITTWEGGRPEEGGDIVAAATPELHAAALTFLRE
ncbi:histidinol-phosphatase [Chelativorans sp. Marseille-P2723]|uniref:histidinol-phosphatase n=1 Tax=Chelativorans sp. Marseille-P2723 TaxID=2709133 RepID=UPI001570B35B|nr:histidinol-phosphatase [Chelativorans sp. Marseille-P2723]